MKNHFIELETERLVLRKLNNSDWKAVSFLRSDSVINKYVKRSSAETKAKALAFISSINQGMDNNKICYWKITEKNRSDMIGSICLWNFSDDQQIAEIGYDLNPSFQRKGIMNESMGSVLNFGFNNLGLSSIEAFTNSGNESSKKLLEKNGFRLQSERKDDANSENIVYKLNRIQFYD